MNNLTITVAIIVITCLTSFLAFNSEKVMNDLIMNPVEMKEKKQWYRFITSGLLHADLMHLLFNMFTLYIFG